jgi:Nucleoside diphosphate kinase
MVKPDATQHLGTILSAIYEAGLAVVHLRMAWLSPGEAAVFYAVHQERPFFAKLQGQACRLSHQAPHLSVKPLTYSDLPSYVGSGHITLSQEASWVPCRG